MKTLFKNLYYIFLMPYLEREKYFDQLVDDVYENDIERILQQNHKGDNAKSNS